MTHRFLQDAGAAKEDLASGSRGGAGVNTGAKAVARGSKLGAEEAKHPNVLVAHTQQGLDIVNLFTGALLQATRFHRQQHACAGQCGHRRALRTFVLPHPWHSLETMCI